MSGVSAECECGRLAMHDALICARCQWLDGECFSRYKTTSAIISALRIYSPLSLNEISEEINSAPRVTLRGLQVLERAKRIGKVMLVRKVEGEMRTIYKRKRNAYRQVLDNTYSYWGYYLNAFTALPSLSPVSAI